MLGATLQHVLWIAFGWGVLICGTILGLKNNPWTAGLFINADGSPSKLAVYLNAAMSLVTGLITCLGGTAGGTEPTATVGMFPFVLCALAAIGAFLSAAGIHLAFNMLGGTTTKTVVAATQKKGAPVSPETIANAH